MRRPCPMQYSLRPSFLSLDRVFLGREQNRALLHAINGRLRAMPAHSRPKFVALGGVLGAFTLQDAFLHEGTAGLERAGMPAGTVIGTPAESEWAVQWRLLPEETDPEHRVVEVASYGEWLELPEETRKEARYILLSHHDDPITVFSPTLAVQAPDWMSNGPERNPVMPEGVPWRPLTTFLLTTVDVLNASDASPASSPPAATTTAPTWPDSPNRLRFAGRRSPLGPGRGGAAAARAALGPPAASPASRWPGRGSRSSAS